MIVGIYKHDVIKMHFQVPLYVVCVIWGVYISHQIREKKQQQNITSIKWYKTCIYKSYNTSYVKRNVYLKIVIQPSSINITFAITLWRELPLQGFPYN